MLGPRLRWQFDRFGRPRGTHAGQSILHHSTKTTRRSAAAASGVRLAADRGVRGTRVGDDFEYRRRWTGASCIWGSTSCRSEESFNRSLGGPLCPVAHASSRRYRNPLRSITGCTTGCFRRRQNAIAITAGAISAISTSPRRARNFIDLDVVAAVTSCPECRRPSMRSGTASTRTPSRHCPPPCC